MGVMATVSCVELWWHSAVQLQDWLGVTAAVAVGAVAFALLDPLLPQHHEPHQLLSEQEIGTMVSQMGNIIYSMVSRLPPAIFDMYLK